MLSPLRPTRLACILRRLDSTRSPVLRPDNAPDIPSPKIGLVSLNTARARRITVADGRSILTAHGKQPTRAAIPVGPLGLEGDEQADPTVHGGRGKAVYAYPHEHYAFWKTVRSQARVQLWEEEPAPGLMGENLTITGLLETHAWVGDRLRFARCTLAISEPRMPCSKFDAVMGFKHASKMMVQSGFCGFYLSVILEGALQVGDEAELVPGPRQLTIADAFRSKAGRQHLR
ncbi:MAG: MOSC domain-containing protein [Betaproteobacteria bacterium]|nr:MOSC domain-containing protein [Betaproteobacteria bacterium]NBT10838.1 MOSC domain-containing protein [Betaproteobacteria bacterium]NBU49827.1 MOSC domain-containing protein [Betaproteobacteria bacterium]